MVSVPVYVAPRWNSYVVPARGCTEESDCPGGIFTIAGERFAAGLSPVTTGRSGPADETAASTAAQVRVAMAMTAARAKVAGVGWWKREECGGIVRLRQRHASVLLSDLP